MRIQSWFTSLIAAALLLLIATPAHATAWEDIEVVVLARAQKVFPNAQNLVVWRGMTNWHTELPKNGSAIMDHHVYIGEQHPDGTVTLLGSAPVSTRIWGWDDPLHEVGQVAPLAKGTAAKLVAAASTRSAPRGKGLVVHTARAPQSYTRPLPAAGPRRSMSPMSQRNFRLTGSRG